MVVAISAEADVVAPLTASRVEQARAIAFLDPWSTTALRDAVVKTLDRLAPEPGRQALVVFSDGTDRYSQVSAAEMLNRARRGPALVYPIVFGRTPVAGAGRNGVADRRALVRPARRPRASRRARQHRARAAASVSAGIRAGRRDRARPLASDSCPRPDPGARGWRVRARDGYVAVRRRGGRMTGAKPAVAASKLAAPVPLGDNLTSTFSLAYGHPDLARAEQGDLPVDAPPRAPGGHRPRRSSASCSRSQEKRIGNALGCRSVATHAGDLLLLFMIGQLLPDKVYESVLPDRLPDIVWLAQPGPAAAAAAAATTAPSLRRRSSSRARSRSPCRSKKRRSRSRRNRIRSPR